MPLLCNLIVFALGPFIALASAVRGCPSNGTFRLWATAVDMYLTLGGTCQIPYTFCNSYFDAANTTEYEYTLTNNTILTVAKAPGERQYQVGHFAYSVTHKTLPMGTVLQFGKIHNPNTKCALSGSPADGGCRLMCEQTTPGTTSGVSVVDQHNDNQWYIQPVRGFYRTAVLVEYI
ncbi:hypothetical protein BDY17DRAFT_297780 [Neohortaea acidophila]|uniref:Uncharacterized protein n=1 Tax=Neohortaea acidophila TaxID=245834 RepID=A0A6A6PVA4_9PEZI|nr:uncharacterized protein BDY17DRAFT_297780 [Neohortaea acidophila]KAF2483651.1 hypothetical protein BDY17DRAFT_297780 [Neohortaea acidophila]